VVVAGVNVRLLLYVPARRTSPAAIGSSVTRPVVAGRRRVRQQARGAEPTVAYAEPTVAYAEPTVAYGASGVPGPAVERLG